MGSRNRTTLVLLAILAVLFGYYWFYQKDKVAPVDPDTADLSQTQIKVFNFDISTVSEMSWKYDSTSAKVVKDSSGNWKVSDQAILTDSNKISAFVGSVLSLYADQKYPASEIPNETSGLDKPGLTINLKKTDGTSDSISFGSKSFTSSEYYAQIGNSQDILLVSTYLVEDLKVDPYTLVPDPSTQPSPSSSSFQP
jgi:hypothetical protein